jgi:tetratricopeptide (TPR) repeat protein
MSEPLPTEPADGAPNGASREARIERLLLTGLDHYFAGRYERAIDIWTRVAFLERGHGRARAYIERARSAQAERQRESEELVESGVAAYHAGQFEAARELLTRSLSHGGSSETALVFLQRLNHLEAVTTSEVEPRRAAHVKQGDPPRTNWALTVVASAALAAVILVARLPLTSWVAERPIAEPDVRSPVEEPLPVVSVTATHLERARALRDAGRLHEALSELDRVSPADARRAEADTLKASVQRDLLATLPRPDAAGRRSP